MNDPKTNDAISRSEALESAELISWYHANQKGNMVPGASSSGEAYVKFNDVVSLLENATTIDVVPVVRCEECRYRFTDNCPMYFEELTYNEDDGYEWIDRDHTSDDGFCNEGARMDGEAE